MKGYNHFAFQGENKPGEKTYLWIQVVYSGYCILDVAALKGFPDVHSPFDTLEINRRRKTSFLTKLFCGGLVTLDNEVIHD